MSYRQAHARAQQLATKTGEAHYVVYESGDWDVATAFDLDTFYAGNRDIETVQPR